VTPAETDAVAAAPSRRRRIAAWTAIGIVLLVVGGAGAWISGLGDWTQRGALDPESAGPAGTRAIARILEQNGVEVMVTRDRLAAAEALAQRSATLALPDAPALSDDGLRALTAGAADVVLLDPRSRTLELLLPGSSPVGEADGAPVDPACPRDEAQRAGAVMPGAVYLAGDEVTACYPSGAGAGLLVAEDGGTRVAALDARALLANDVLADDGNAALGLNLLGRHAVVVWYLPTLADSDIEDTDVTLGELTPPWVSPAIVLLLAAGVAAGVWRGRRFGPLVAERLPVTVRAAETAEGRARLYSRARDAEHAADQLRLDTLDRLARLVGLGPSASALEVSDAAAAVSGRDPRAVRAALVDGVPASDADLVALSVTLRDLERAVHAAARQERTNR
jgi:hypothetical protein